MGVILAVEDEMLILIMAETLLEEWGHTTLSATDVREALSHVDSAHHIDALFTDIHLERSAHGGFDLARHAVLLRPQLAVLYTSGNALTGEMQSMFVRGARFLPKPYMDHQLKDAIDELLTTQSCA